MGHRPRRPVMAAAGPADDGPPGPRCRGHRRGRGCGCATSGSANGCPRRSRRCSPPGCCRCWRTASWTGCRPASGCGCRSATPWSTAGTTSPPQSRRRCCSPGYSAGRGRAVKILYNALIRVNRDPAAADHAVLSDLDRQWREDQQPRLPAASRRAAESRRTRPPAPPGAAGRPARPGSRDPAVVPGHRRWIGVKLEAA